MSYCSHLDTVNVGMLIPEVHGETRIAQRRSA